MNFSPPRIAGIGFNTGDVGGDLSRLAQQLARFDALGCTMAEITATGLDAVSACRLIPHRVAAVRDILASHAFSLSMHAPIAINLMDEPHLALQQRAAVASVELAAAIGATTVVLHPGRVHPDLWATASERLFALEIDVLGAVGDRAAALGVRIAYENISPNPRVIAGVETSYSLDPRALGAQLTRLSHKAAVACLDVSHAQQGATLLGFEMIAACTSLAPHVPQPSGTSTSPTRRACRRRWRGRASVRRSSSGPATCTPRRAGAPSILTRLAVPWMLRRAPASSSN